MKLGSKLESESTQIIKAYTNNNLELLHKYGVDKSYIKTKNNDYLPLLHYICRGNLIGFYDILIKNNINFNVNLIDFNNNTPLSIACLYENIDIVKKLLEHPNIDVNKSIKMTSLKKCDNKEILKLLLSRTDISSKNDIFQQMFEDILLHNSEFCGNMKLLLDTGCNPFIIPYEKEYRIKHIEIKNLVTKCKKKYLLREFSKLSLGIIDRNSLQYKQLIMAKELLKKENNVFILLKEPKQEVVSNSMLRKKIF